MDRSNRLTARVSSGTGRLHSVRTVSKSEPLMSAAASPSCARATGPVGARVAAGGAAARPLPLIEKGADGVWYAPSRPTPVIPYSSSPIESTDVLQHDLVLTVDPATGATSGELTLLIRAEQPSVGSLTLLIDADLAYGGATVEGVSANINSQVFGSYHQGTISFPPLAQGEQATVIVDYAGTMTCARPDALCDVNPDMSVLMQGSGVPHVFDASFLGGYNVWGVPRSLELVLPSGTDAVVPGVFMSP